MSLNPTSRLSAALQLPLRVPSVLAPARIRNCGTQSSGFLLLTHVRYVGGMLNIATNLEPKNLEVVIKITPRVFYVS